MKCNNLCIKQNQNNFFKRKRILIVIHRSDQIHRNLPFFNGYYTLYLFFMSANETIRNYTLTKKETRSLLFYILFIMYI